MSQPLLATAVQSLWNNFKGNFSSAWNATKNLFGGVRNVSDSLASAGTVTDGHDISWLDSMFDSVRNEQEFNSAQAALEREFNASEAEKGRQFNAEQAALQREYEREMSNTAYQRAAADMRAAGLNPYLMYGSGSAASTPSGAAASGYTASSTSARTNTGTVTATVLSSLFNSASSLMRAYFGGAGEMLSGIGFGK